MRASRLWSFEKHPGQVRMRAPQWEVYIQTFHAQKMETLERHSIAIDNWSVLFPENTTFLLSHLHTDHATIPKAFQFPVYASEATGVLMDNPHRAIRPVLEPNGWYRTHHYLIPFKVYKTMHTVESIGFYFPSLSVLYMGDCVESIIPSIPRPLTIIYDGLYEHVTRTIPSTTQSCALIHQTLKECPVLQLVHHGILSFIAASCHTRFRLHPSAPQVVSNAARYLNLVNDTSPYMLVGRSYKDGPRIVPSSYWFMRKTSLDPFEMHTDGDKLRIFCTLHARADDILTWKDTNPYAHFEVLATNPI
jgi:hypothetical protein